MTPQRGHWVWALIAALCLAGVGLWRQLNDHRTQPAAMAAAVEQDLHKRQRALEQLLSNAQLVQRMFSDQLTAVEVEQLSQQPFFIYAFEQGNTLLFWNSNTVVGTCESPRVGTGLLYQNNGWYYRQCLHPQYLSADQELVVLLPIKTFYRIENAYLRSAFAAADFIPAETDISESPAPSKWPVKAADGTPLFYLAFNPAPSRPDPPGGWVSALLVAGVFSGCVWLQLLALQIARRRRHAGWLFVAAVVFFVLWRLQDFLPLFRLERSWFFNPLLYAGFQTYPSLGHLTVHITAYTWLLVYGGAVFQKKYLSGPFGRRLPYLLGLASGCAVLVAATIVSAQLIRSLVLDSQLDFDLVNLLTTDWHMLVCVVVLSNISGLNLLLVFLINRQLKPLGHNYLKYGFLVGWVGLAAFFQQGLGGWIDAWLTGWLLLAVFIMDVKPFPRRQFSNTEKILYYCVFMALCVTPFVRYLVLQKEERNRSSFVQQVVHERDEVLESLLPSMRRDLARRGDLPALFVNAMMAKNNLADTLREAHFRGQLNNYDILIRTFDTLGNPVANADTGSLRLFTSHVVDTNSGIGYRQNPAGGYHYFTIAPVSAGRVRYGTVVVELYPQRQDGNALYPELLQPATPGRRLQPDYTYAVYIDQTLETQTENHPFPLYLRNDTLQPGNQIVYWRDDYRVYRYRPDEHTTVMMIQFSRPFISWITTFSFILIALAALSLAIWGGLTWFRATWRGRTQVLLIPTTLRGRIFLAIPSLVFLAFLAIGTTTWIIFKDRNVAANKLRIRRAMGSTTRLILDYINNRQVPTTYQGVGTLRSDRNFQEYIAFLAQNRGTDINVYDSLGTLLAASQPAIYTKGLLAGIMNPDAYHTLTEEEKAVELQQEAIGSLTYLSCYVPLRNPTGKAYAYLNVPSFSSTLELNNQISNVLVAMIDVYVFMLLVSIGATFFLANRLTKGLKMITAHFNQYDLMSREEEISWPEDDEIGQMVAAYNANLKKAKEAIKELARREREGAWRDMAQQVAHEIKNPLTPMKLHIQMLQMALQGGQERIGPLAQRVSATLLEQIDNLALIASAFSDFAKMPEANPEPIALSDVLRNVVEMNQYHSGVMVVFQELDTHLVVVTDRGQMLRVMNNLLQNAIDAMPAGRHGIITVTLQRDGAFAQITVADNGSGIPADIRDKIFSPYFTTKSSGTGLGLAMTRRIIEFWRGSIRFDTEQDRGTTFYILLPLAPGA